MLTEGIGLHPPHLNLRNTVMLSDHEIMAIAEAISEIASQYKDRTDSWGRGLLGGTSLGIRVSLPSHLVSAFAGKCGEQAFWTKAMKRYPELPPPDLKRRRGGDGGVDANIRGIKLQLKTRVTSKQNLVRIYPDKPLPGAAHVFCEWDRGHRVIILGWLPNRRLREMPKAPTRQNGNWWNYVAQDSDLLPLNQLWAFIDGRSK